MFPGENIHSSKTCGLLYTNRFMLLAWQEKEKDIESYLLGRNFLLIQPDRYAVKYTRLRIQGERILQSLQGLYRTLFDKDITGTEYDYTL